MHRNKQWYSPEATCMDVLDNNEPALKLIHLQGIGVH